MRKKDYYEILEIERNASSDAVKKAYRRMALKYHPDRNPGNSEAEERFKEAAEAYSVLIDDEKRALYDRFGHDGLRGEGFSGFSGFNSSIFQDFEDILGSFFGFGDIFGTRQHRRPFQRRGRDLALEMEISLDEAASGVEKKFNINRTDSCPVCKGSKLQPGTKKEVCKQCQGRGQVRYQQGFFTISRVCSYCQGLGEVITNPCQECRGSGKKKKKKALTVKIPVGVDEGMKLRIEGEGDAGDEGAPNGDLYIIIRIKKHKFFEREGSDLHCEVSISFSQAALGASIEIPTLEENELLKIPAGIQSGELLKLKGRGIKDIDTQKRGDLLVRINITTPTNLTKEQKEILKKLAESRGEKLDIVDKGIVSRVKNIFH